MEKQIKFTPYDTTKTDIDCSDGEVEMAYGLQIHQDGAYHKNVSLKALLRLPDGYKVIAIHAGRAIIAQTTEGHTSLYYSWVDTETESISAEEMTYIDQLEEIQSIDILNNAVMLATAVGMKHLIWNQQRYILLDWRPRLPIIEFGLQRTATLSCGDSMIVSSEAINNTSGTGIPGSGASQTHPTTTIAKTEKTNLSQTIMTSLRNALESQILSKGYFYQPFFVRYALRMRDGSHLCQSPPILMLPTVLPPRVGITTSEIDDNNARISIDLSANNIFQLRYRISSGIDSRWTDLIDAIDIYISDEINTYRTDKDGEGYITSYNEVLAATDGTSVGRGRRYISREGEAAGIFDGHYSLGGDQYSGHTLEWLQTRAAWFIAPNPHLADDLCTAHTFYRVASIPYSIDEVRDEFSPVAISTTQSIVLRQHRQLTDSVLDQEPLPSAIKTFGNQAVIASDRYRLSSPYPLRGATAYCGSATPEAGLATQISVYVRRHGSVYKTTTECEGFPTLLSAYMPRYLYYPDPSAFMMTITQQGVTYALPLLRHEHLPGSFWWGGLQANCEAETGTDYENSGDTISGGSVVYTSTPDNTMVFYGQEKLSLGHCKICAMENAMRAPAAGDFGKYPMYVLTDRGVLMLQYDDALKVFKSARLIGEERCINPTSVESANGRVVFASMTGLHCIDGSHIGTISSGIESMTFDFRVLPHIEKILTPIGISAIEEDTHNIYQQCITHYDMQHDILVVSLPGKSYSLIYSFCAKSWAVVDMAIDGKICCEGAGLVNARIAYDTQRDGVIYECVARVTEADYDQRGLLISRPIKISKSVSTHNILNLEILGRFGKGHVATILYGATRLDRWHLISTSRTEIIEDYNSRKYRYLRIVSLSQLKGDEYVQGALLTTSDD